LQLKNKAKNITFPRKIPLVVRTLFLNFLYILENKPALISNNKGGLFPVVFGNVLLLPSMSSDIFKKIKIIQSVERNY